VLNPPDITCTGGLMNQPDTKRLVSFRLLTGSRLLRLIEKAIVYLEAGRYG
jgi:hypothetical protein